MRARLSNSAAEEPSEARSEGDVSGPCADAAALFSTGKPAHFDSRQGSLPSNVTARHLCKLRLRLIGAELDCSHRTLPTASEQCFRTAPPLDDAAAFASRYPAPRQVLKCVWQPSAPSNTMRALASSSSMRQWPRSLCCRLEPDSDLVDAFALRQAYAVHSRSTAARATVRQKIKSDRTQV